MTSSPLTARGRWLSLLACLWLTGCGGADDSPDSQVRAVIAAAERAAESRDVGDLMALVAADFRTDRGEGPEELRRYLRGYFIANQSIRLVTRIERLEFPGPDVAELEVSVGSLGREAGGEAWDLAVDVRSFDVTLMREGGEWRVTRAAWRSGGP